MSLSRQKLPESCPTSNLPGPTYHPLDTGCSNQLAPPVHAGTQSAEGLLADCRVGYQEADLPSQEVEVDLEECGGRGDTPRVLGGRASSCGGVLL